MLYGTGQTADSLTYTFNHQDINNRDTTDAHNPWKLLSVTLATATPNATTGAYPNGGSVGNSGSYSIIYKRIAPFGGVLEVGQPGDYFDDFAEIYVNGTITAWNSQFTGNLRGSLQVEVD